jgi:hypothetical protein
MGWKLASAAACGLLASMFSFNVYAFPGLPFQTSEEPRVMLVAEGCGQTRDSFIKEQFLEVAKKWRDMAEHEDNRRR